MKTFREIVRKYLGRNEDTLFSDNIIHEMNGDISVKSKINEGTNVLITLPRMEEIA